MKRSLRAIPLIGLLAIISPQLMAQGHICASMDNLHDHNSDPLAKTYYEQVKEEIFRLANEQYAGRGVDDIITIPVVFHVIHNGDDYGTGENVTDEQLLSQIDALNESFRKMNADVSTVPATFAPLAADTEIEFCLARFDPSGNPSSGITRQQYPAADWDRPQIEATLKPATIWDRSRYLNIWVVRFGGDLATEGVLGYAQFPGMAANTDGVVIDFEYIGTTGAVSSPYHLGRTTVHEVGHWLGLYHIWGDDGGACPLAPGGSDDGIADTPDQGGEYYNCPTGTLSSCGSLDMFMNYMDYTSDACGRMFTEGQKAVMVATLNSDRGSILSASYLCDYNADITVANVIQPSDLTCDLMFNPIVEVKNLGTDAITSFDMFYSLDGGSLQLYSWVGGSIASGGSEFVTLPVQNVTVGSHSMTFTLSNPNGEADDFVGNDNKTVSFTAAGTSPGSSSFPLEGFEGTFPPSGWTIDNPDASIAWEKSTEAGGYSGSASSMVYDNFTSSGSPVGERDAIETIDYSFDGTYLPYMNFDVAYAQRSAGLNDSLLVSFSVDCGNSWHTIYAKGGADLATAATSSSVFTPTSTEWRTEFLGLHYLVGASHVRFKFENVTGWGNRIFVDNINLKQQAVGVLTPEAEWGFKVFPNPAKTSLQYQLQGEWGSETTLAVYSAIGAEMHKQLIVKGTGTIDVSKFALGIYYVHLMSGATNKVLPLVIAE